MKADLDKYIENLDDNSLLSLLSSSTLEVLKAKPTIQKPSQEDLQLFFKSLNDCKDKPVCLSLVQPYSESFVSKTRGIKPISDLFDEKYLDLNYIELLKKCNAVQLHLSDTDIRLIEKDTINQARGNSFYRHRTGRIGGSRSRAASHTDPS